jgi:hypothetical protein
MMVKRKDSVDRASPSLFDGSKGATAAAVAFENCVETGFSLAVVFFRAA